MNEYREKLMSKSEKAIILLSRELITLDAGDRIKTVEQYSEALKLGRGTIQSALSFLQRENIITLDSRGHLGTYISSIDHKKLWVVAGIGTITGVMPLPYSKRYEGLATGLYLEFERANIPFSMAFMRGSTQRIEALKSDRYNFNIMSKLAAEIEMEKYSDIEIVYEFDEYSYVGEHVIIFREDHVKDIDDGMRVAIDPLSLNQNMLTRLECQDKDVQFIETSYSQILEKLSNNELDAAIWNGDEIKEKSLDFNIREITKFKIEDIGNNDTIATIVTSKDNFILKDIFGRLIDFDEVKNIQRKVQSGEIIPVY